MGSESSGSTTVESIQAARTTHRGCALAPLARDHRQGDLDPSTEQNLAVATLVGRYIARREQHRQHVCAEDLFAAAADFGGAAVDALRILIACCEAMHATG